MRTSASILAVCAAAVLLAAAMPLAAGEESNGFVLMAAEDMEKEEEIREICQGGGSEMFSVGAMFVAFREALEACVIVSVMLNMLNKTGMPEFRKFVWAGTGMGVAVAVVGGTCVVVAYFLVQNALMSYKDKSAFSGTFTLVASLFLTILAVQFLRFKDIEVMYKKKLKVGLEKATQHVKHHEENDLNSDSAVNEPASSSSAPAGASQVEAPVSVQSISNEEQGIASEQAVPRTRSTNNFRGIQGMRAMLKDPDLKGTAISIFVLCFTAVVREGLETFIFLAAFGSEHVHPGGIAVAAVTGIAIGLLLGYFFLIMGKCMKDLRMFLVFATGFMLVISAGLIAMSSQAFKTVALINLGAVDTDFWVTTPLYDIYKSTGNGHQLCGFFAVLRAVVGYTHNPNFVWWIVYLAYWFIVLSILGFRYYKGTLFSKHGHKPFDEDTLENERQGDLEAGVAKGNIESGVDQMGEAKGDSGEMKRVPSPLAPSETSAASSAQTAVQIVQPVA